MSQFLFEFSALTAVFHYPAHASQYCSAQTPKPYIIFPLYHHGISAWYKSSDVDTKESAIEDWLV